MAFNFLVGYNLLATTQLVDLTNVAGRREEGSSGQHRVLGQANVKSSQPTGCMGELTNIVGWRPALASLASQHPQDQEKRIFFRFWMLQLKTRILHLIARDSA